MAATFATNYVGRVAARAVLLSLAAFWLRISNPQLGYALRVTVSVSALSSFKRQLRSAHYGNNFATNYVEYKTLH